jgi:hypothetical protein
LANIGIITCQILELEFAHVLSADAEVADVFVIEDAFSAGLLSGLEAHGKNRYIGWQPSRNSGQRRAPGITYWSGSWRSDFIP